MQDMAEIKLNGMPVEACLLDYVEGRLSAEEARTVEAFLAEHAAWAAQVALLREPMPVSDDAASAVTDGWAAEDLAAGFAAGLTCPPELKARLLRPAEARERLSGRVRSEHSVRPAWAVRSAGAVRRRVYYAAAAVAVLLVASGIVWRAADERLGRQPEAGAVFSASVDVEAAAAMADAGTVLSADAGLAGAVLSAEPKVEPKVKSIVEPIVAQAVAEAGKAEEPAAAAVALPRAICEVPPLQGGRLLAERFEIGGSEPALLARVSTEAAAGFSEEAEARRSRFEPDALIAQAYVALARRIERQRIRREIKREVTASLQADAEMQPAFWNIYN